MSQYQGTRPDPFVHDAERGRGPTLKDAINDAIEKKGGQHGQVFHIELFVTVSNPHVGEYIVELD
jgi:hypothetical protein